ncbi:hypothetical protein C2G38_2201979 [Gigaspora rosea]|uniref:Uncharacterized protein n=1 Tax=Gigaspora rosea TaxID=44941 RepID=A0A397UPB1_9GLOM|nr:hypothetical protein C2G38_2201979 [Gigaspora rosea]
MPMISNRNEIENEVRDITDVDSDEVEDEAANETEKETSDETEEETINFELQNDRQRLFYITKKYDLPIEKLSPQSHYPEYREDKGSCVWRHFKLWLSKGNTTKIHHEVKCGANCVMYLYVSKSNVQIALLSTMSLNNKINTDFAPWYKILYHVCYYFVMAII